MENLGKDIIVEISKLLDLENALNLGITSKTNNNYIVKNKNFWFRRGEKDFSVHLNKDQYIKIYKEVLRNKKRISSMKNYLLFFNSQDSDNNTIYVNENLSLTEIFVYYIISDKINNCYSWRQELSEEIDRILKNTEFEKIVTKEAYPNKEEINIYKNLLYKSIDFRSDKYNNNKDLVEFENTIKQYVYLGILPINPTTNDLINIPLFFRIPSKDFI